MELAQNLLEDLNEMAVRAIFDLFHVLRSNETGRLIVFLQQWH